MDELTKRIYDAKKQFSKFRDRDFREYQVEAIKFITEATKKIVVCCLPTGAGKSLIGAVSAEVNGGGIYMVHSKPLQVQLQGDFPELPILWGRGNYKCLQSQGRASCGECTHTQLSPCENKAGKCEYVVAKRIARNAPTKILNYEYWITETNYVGQFAGESMVVIDEADSLEGTMARFINLEFSEGMLRMLGITTPKYKTTTSEHSIDNWKDWADTAGMKVERLIGTMTTQLSCANPDPEIIARKERLTGIKRKLDMFVESVDSTWLYDEKEYEGRTTISFKPTWISPYVANKYVWSKADKFVLMSATFPPMPVLAKTLGVKLGDIVYKEFKSTFDPDNRPIILNPVANITYKSEPREMEAAIGEIKKLLEKHKGEKGLIHTVSYKLTKAVMDIGDPRLVTHNGSNKIDAIEEFRESKEPLVMVSPSSERGISLDGDMCRWCVWLKAPFLSLGDKLVSARIYKSTLGNLWYKSNAIMTVVQGCGRLVRSKEDYGVVYILDAQIVKLLTENPSMAPYWWREAIV